MREVTVTVPGALFDYMMDVSEDFVTEELDGVIIGTVGPHDVYVPNRRVMLTGTPAQIRFIASMVSGYALSIRCGELSTEDIGAEASMLEEISAQITYSARLGMS